MVDPAYVRTPLVYLGSANGLQYSVTRDFDSADSGTGRIFARTTVDVEVDTSVPGSFDLVPPFPAYVWFRKAGGNATAPQGELIFEFHPQRSKTIAAALRAKGLLAPSYLSCAGVTLDVGRWKTLHRAWLASLPSKKLRDDQGNVTASLTGKTPEYIFDTYFLAGQVPIEVKGGSTEEPLPVVPPTSGTATLTLCMGHLNAETFGGRPPSAQALVNWSLANPTKGLDEFASPGGYAYVTPIPVGYFYSLVDKSLFASKEYAEHFLLRNLLQVPEGFWDSMYNPLWIFVGQTPNVLRWRRFMLTGDYAPRTAPMPLPAWGRYDLIVGAQRQAATAAGESYWRMKDDTVTVGLETRDSPPARLRVRALYGDFANDAAVTVDGPDVAVIVDQPVTFLVKDRTDPANQYANQASPLDLSGAGAPHDHRHAVHVMVGDVPVYELCPGKWQRSRSVVWGEVIAAAYKRWGMTEPGALSLEAAIKQHWATLTAENWTHSQRRVLSAMSANEGSLDAVNTYDDAYLSLGILQWALFTREGRGELATLLTHIDRTEPARYQEYFGHFRLGHRGVAPYPADSVPRGFVVARGTTMDDTGPKDDMRRYEWSVLFRLAALDPLIQLAQLRLAYDRFRILRDRALTLSNGNAYTIGELFTSEHAAALLFDQHTNNPQRVDGDMRDAIGNRTTVDSSGIDRRAFSQSDLEAIVEAYAGPTGTRARTNHMTTPGDRRDKIDKWRDTDDSTPGTALDRTAGSFQWPTGAAMDWPASLDRP